MTMNNLNITKIIIPVKINQGLSYAIKYSSMKGWISTSSVAAWSCFKSRRFVELRV